MKNNLSVLIAAGGSGGHIFPALALARRLIERDRTITVSFVGTNRELDRRLFAKEGFAYDLLSGNKLPYRFSLATLLFYVSGVVDVLRMVRILVRRRPDVVIGFGGYPSSIAIIMARCAGIPRMVHEQNVTPGRANRLLSSWVDEIAISFEESRRFFAGAKRPIVHTGNPIRAFARPDAAVAGGHFALASGLFTILVVGGSQGAHRLNEAFIRDLGQCDAALRAQLQVIHLTGVSDYAWAMVEYQKLGVTHRVWSFIDRIEEAYSAANLIITRCGASALFEIAYFGKPMIVVPYPFAMNHQLENAQVFARHGAAILVEEKDMVPGTFSRLIQSLLRDRVTLEKLGTTAQRLSTPDASDRFADRIFALANNRCLS